MTEKWHLISNCGACSSCNNCVLVTNDEYVGNAFPGYSAPKPAAGTPWMEKKRVERGNDTMIDVAHYIDTCMMCRDPVCVNKKTEGVVYQRDDGIVIIDPDKAKGRKDIVGMCPHGHIHWNEELELPQKWTWDAHLLDDGWKAPRAASVCPTGGLVAVKATDEEMDARVASGELTMRDPVRGSRLYDKGFERITKHFLGASIVTTVDGVEDCAEGTPVALKQDGAVIAQAEADEYGEFRFDGLDGEGAVYTLEIAGVSRDITLDKSLYLGVIELPAA
ncbi:MAG: 4Fe-4S dicluster domain-containing protein [Pseudomonadota bacterium]